VSTNNAPVIVCFRQDLRLCDNPALLVEHEGEQPIVPLYIFDNVNSSEWAVETTFSDLIASDDPPKRKCLPLNSKDLPMSF
jgi:hypothetical protein